MSNLHSDDARAAARLAGLPSQVRSDPVVQLSRGPADDGDWQTLAEQVVAASRVQVVGVMPELLIEALRRELEKTTNGHLPPLDYYTPLPEFALNLERGLHSYARRWQAGYMGLRNLVMATDAQATEQQRASGYRHFGFGLSALSFNCLLYLTTASGANQAFALTELLGSGARPDYLVHSLSANDPDLTAYLAGVAREGQPIRLREVRCRGIDDASPADDVQSRLRISQLVPLGAGIRPPNILRPVAIVVVRCQSPRGLEVVLKRRSPLTDTDDFGKLSLLSARVQESDVAAALSAAVSPSHESDEIAFEDLWLAAGSPKPFYLPVEAFRIAAQREVGVTLGLHLDLERFEPKGFQLVQHESAAVQQLAFMVFTLELVRSGQVDELRMAMSRNVANLERVPAAEMYRDEGQLNRLLRQRKHWLIENCFGD